jgi:dTDP-4-dehydrorhamnose reductase
MRILILGGSGMIGHRLWLAAHDEHETWVTLRGRLADHPWSSLFDPQRTIEGVSAEEPGSLDRAMSTARPNVVVNALGLIKQRPEGSLAGPAFLANCYVPHHMRGLCDAYGARLVQLSTDCVFTGDRGRYAENDVPDALDVYGLTKRLGEVGPPHLTLRVSALGRSLSGTDGLLEWFLSQPGPVTGYRRALFSGLVTETLGETVVRIVTDHSGLSGLWHVASPPIDKYDLLLRLRDAFSLGTEIRGSDMPIVDRSLDDCRFRTETGIPRPAWDDMIDRLARDPTPYALLRGEKG